MKHTSLGELNVSRLGLGTVGMSAVYAHGVAARTEDGR
jgi:hypothetical protein